MVQLTAEHIEELNDFSELIEALRQGFSQDDIVVPKRHHHDYPNPGKQDSTLLLMPAWQAGKFLGVKMVTVSPENGKQDLPAIQGLYTLFDADTGQIIAQMDGKALTAKRTAAASALAGSFLSRKEANTLLMVGTGALSKPIIEAHAAIRPISHVRVWGRTPEKAQDLLDQLENKFQKEIARSISAGMEGADIISCATLSPEPLVFGKDAKPGQHFDLVGAYKPDMREADDALIQKARVFVDTPQGIHESGDLHIPLTTGVISEGDIQGDLYEMTKGKAGRNSEEEITLFKSVGHALEDLVAAVYFYQKALNAT